MADTAVKMRCEVCGAEIAEGSGSCPVCGCPVIYQIGGDAAAAENLKRAADEYRSQLFTSLEVGFVAYSHKVVTGEDGKDALRLDHEDKISLGSYSKFDEEEIHWYPEGFLRPLTPELECSVFVRRGSEAERVRKVSVPLPQGAGDIHIGMMRSGTGAVRVCIGNAQDYNCSEEIPVLQM